jgi:hypothetical protein
MNGGGVFDVFDVFDTAFNLLLRAGGGSSPPKATMAEWRELNERINATPRHVCTPVCFSDVRKVLRRILAGEVSCILEGGAAVRTAEQCDCLRSRLVRLCKDELGLDFLRDAQIAVLVENTIVTMIDESRLLL